MAVETTAGAGMPEEFEGVLRIGDVVGGKLVVEGVLGVGGMGVVLSARHQQLGQKVAIKLLRPAAAKYPEAVSRFLREARAAVNLQSTHVVRVMDVGTLDSGMPYMVMEHLTGSDLSALLEARGPLPVAEAVDYVLQGLEAVAEAHTIGLVHRDLKPANLFVTRMPDGSNLVKVLDFGISKAVQGAANDPSLTATTAVLGSPMYMSPEQLRSSKNVDARTDLWAVGVILYELVSGRYPFEDDTVTGVCARIAADPPIPLRTHRADLPPPFDAVVMRCLEKDVSRRVQTVSELAAALRPFASPEGQLAVDRIARIAGAPPPPISSVPIRVELPRGTAFATSDAVTATHAAPTNPPRAGKAVRLAIGVSLVVVAVLGTFIALRSWPAARTPEHASVRPATAATVPAAAQTAIVPPAPPAAGAASSPAPSAASSTPAPAGSAQPASSRPTLSRAPGRPTGAAPAASTTKSSDDLFLERK